MRITTKGRYALRAILHLHRMGEGKPVSIKKISEDTSLSPVFLEQIFYRLRKAGIISSTRGPGGGFSFTKDPSEVTIDDIFEAIDEGYFITPCSENDSDLPENCEYAEDCCACDFWRHTYTTMRNYFSAISLQNVLDKEFPSMT